LAHKLAKELGHNIGAIAGTGPGGRVIAADVKEFVPMEHAAAPATSEAPAAATPAPAQMAIASAVASGPPPVVGAGFTDYPLSDVARETAARLAQSKRNVPHYYLTIDLSMDELLKMRNSINNTIRDEDDKIGVYELLLKAAAVATKAVPSANAAWMDSVVRVYSSIDINVVVGNGDALYTPVIADVGGRGVKALAADLKAAVQVLEEGGEELSPNFMSMGTMTVMNLGMYGIKSCAPIIREPQACALAFGVIENRIVPSDKEDELYRESVMMTATMSFDHRVVDGAVGAQWLAAFKSHVENPSTLLL
jgi:pyruvate dehydrogenase E2 component (dihydrolipoamide acetyltransferase)